jgi:hypothetical protein
MKIYANYINGYDKGLELFGQSMKITAFKKLIDEKLAASDQTNMTAYLIQPVQRIPRYVLLLSV